MILIFSLFIKFTLANYSMEIEYENKQYDDSEVETIINKRVKEGVEYYLIKFKG